MHYLFHLCFSQSGAKTHFSYLTQWKLVYLISPLKDKQSASSSVHLQEISVERIRDPAAHWILAQQV